MPGDIHLLKVDEAFLEGKNVVAAFLDVKGAFDNVNVDILLDELSSLGCSDSIIEFVKFLTHCRYIHADCLEDDIRTAYKGVPQGGVLSPLLYIIYVSSITKNLYKSVYVSQFADDIGLYVKSESTKWAKNTIEKSVNTIATNLHEKGLDLAPNKMKMLHFNKQHILPGTINIKVQDCVIKSTDSVKFLGIHFDYQLSFEYHVNQLVAKCSRALNIIKFVCSTKWGSDPETLVILYKSYVRSIIEYGSYIYCPLKANLLEKMQKIQNSAIRTALGYRISTY